MHPRTLLERISGASKPESVTSHSPAAEGDTDDKVSSPPHSYEIEGVKVDLYEAEHPPLHQINATINLCRAIIKYKEDNPEADDHVSVVTEDLGTFIRAMAKHDSSVPLPITHREFNRIAHLTYITSFTDAIEPYIFEVEWPKTLLECMATPSHISISDEEEETSHPGEGWVEYDARNPRHYPLVFVNEDRQEEVARYIRFHPVGDGMVLQGRRTKYTPVYGAPLHARPFPHANFNGNTPRDTDLAIFHPSASNRAIVDDALLNLGDAGVVADVHTLRQQYLRLATIRQQRAELGRQELQAEEKKNDMERFLTHAAVRTRLVPHLVRTRPRTPPSSVIPRIHAAQGPPDTDPVDCEGEDSLE